MNSWKQYILSDFARINPRVNLIIGNEYPFLAMESVEAGKRFVDILPYEKYSGNGTKFEAGDTVFARITPCLENGKIAQFNIKNGKLGFGSTEFFIFRGKSGISDSDFLYYLTQTYEIRKYAENSMAGASGRQRADLNYLKKIVIFAPSIDKQKIIASILSLFDEFIENNSQRIKISEEMLKLLYREWFVEFRFPGYEKIKFVDSELGKIPEGWEIIDAQKILKFIKGFEPGYDSYAEVKKFEYIPFYRVGDLGSESNNNVYVHKDLVGENICNEKDILVSLDGTVGKVVFGYSGAYSSGIRKVISKDNSIKPSYIYSWLKSYYVQSLINVHATGSTILHASSVLKYLKFLFNEKVIGEFQKISEPIYWEMLSLKESNKILVETRNLLLPKLISGEIDISFLNMKTKEN